MLLSCIRLNFMGLNDRLCILLLNKYNVWAFDSNLKLSSSNSNSNSSRVHQTQHLNQLPYYCRTSQHNNTFVRNEMKWIKIT